MRFITCMRNGKESGIYESYISHIMTLLELRILKLFFFAFVKKNNLKSVLALKHHFLFVNFGFLAHHRSIIWIKHLSGL